MASDHTLSAKISAAISGGEPEGGGITKQKLATWYAHAIRLEDVLDLMRMTEVKLAEYSTGHFKRAEAAEAKLKWHEETQRTYYDVEARAAAAEAEVARLREKHDADATRAVEMIRAAEQTAVHVGTERDALRVENERLRAFTNDPREQDLFMAGYKHMRTADALRAKLDAVRAEVDAVIDFEQGLKLQERLLAILDGKGGE